MLALILLYGSMQAMNEQPLSIQEAATVVQEQIVAVLIAMRQVNGLVPCGYSISKSVQFPWLPGYTVKINNDRMRGASFLQSCISQQGLNLLRVPGVVEVTLPSRAELKSDLPPIFANIAIPSTLCVVEDLKGTPNGVLNLVQTKQLVTLLTKAEKPYVSCIRNKIVYMDDGCIGLCNTSLQEDFHDNPALGLDILYKHNALLPKAQCYMQEILHSYNGNQI